jgi:aromatic-L-amino-acid decarboxylase
VKNRQHLLDAFAFNPPYYSFADDEHPGENYYALGLQNSRSFRALKVWLSLRHAGRQGYTQMIGDDIRLAQQLYTLAKAHTLLEAHTCNLSICTFRFVPEDLATTTAEHHDYLNDLNKALLLELQQSGEAFLSNAIINNNYLLRACVVNFRTSTAIIEKVPEIVVKIGQRLDGQMREV